MNTPMANSGMSELVLPRTATSRAPDMAASAHIPLLNTNRSPRMESRCGSRLSRASRLSSTGRPPNDVLAARPSTTVTLSDTV